MLFLLAINKTRGNKHKLKYRKFTFNIIKLFYCSGGQVQLEETTCLHLPPMNVWLHKTHASVHVLEHWLDPSLCTVLLENPGCFLSAFLSRSVALLADAIKIFWCIWKGWPAPCGSKCFPKIYLFD